MVRVEHLLRFAWSTPRFSPRGTPAGPHPLGTLLGISGHPVDIPPSPLHIQMIKVKTLTGKEIEIDIEPSDTIERIKSASRRRRGFPPSSRGACRRTPRLLTSPKIR